MRRVTGAVVPQPGVSEGIADHLLVEVRDVSLLDAPSRVVAQVRYEAVPVAPGTGIPFELDVPDAPPGSSLAVRAHLARGPGETVRQGDALSTVSVDVPASGSIGGLHVPVSAV